MTDIGDPIPAPPAPQDKRVTELEDALRNIVRVCSDPRTSSHEAARASEQIARSAIREKL